MSFPQIRPGPVPAQAGIGLRFQHHEAVLERRPDIAWMEVHTENYMGGGTAIRCLETIRRDHPISLHGVGLSLGSAQGLDPAHLERIRKVAERIEPALMSEHIAWSVADATYLADLLPLPMTEESLAAVCRHVDQVQITLRRRILVENPSTYLRFRHSTIPEWEFMAAVAERTGCGILCDVNNIYVSARNHDWDPSAYLARLPPAAVGEIHLAGHSVRSLPDCNGRCRCSHTLAHSAIAAIVSGRRSFGCGDGKRMRSIVASAFESRSSAASNAIPTFSSISSST